MRKYANKYMSARGNGYEQFLAHKSDAVVTPGSSVFLRASIISRGLQRIKTLFLYRILKRHVQNVLDFLLTYELDSPYGTYASGIDSVREQYVRKKNAKRPE